MGFLASVGAPWQEIFVEVAAGGLFWGQPLQIKLLKMMSSLSNLVLTSHSSLGGREEESYLEHNHSSASEATSDMVL